MIEINPTEIIRSLIKLSVLSPASNGKNALIKAIRRKFVEKSVKSSPTPAHHPLGESDSLLEIRVIQGGSLQSWAGANTGYNSINPALCNTQ